MNKEEPYRDQAERLKQRIQKITDKVEDSDSEKLPPRELVHRQKKKKTKLKLKYPLIRLLVLCFILLPIIIFSVISYRDSGKKINNAEKTSGNSVGYETINLKKSNQAEETKSDQSKGKGTEQDNNGLSQSEEINEEPAANTEQPITSDSSSTSVQTPNSNTASVNKQETDKNSQQQTNPVKTETNITKPKVVYHTVKPHETLFNLSQKYYKSQEGMDMIKKANNLQTENIYAGQILKIPINN